MKRTAIMLVIFGALFAGSPSARADSGNPFGFETDKHPLEYEYCEKAEANAFKKQYWYECSSAPRIHPDIEAYFLHFVEDIGLCQILVDSFDFNDKLGKKFERFKRQIAKKYGPPNRKSEEGSYVWDQEAELPT